MRRAMQDDAVVCCSNQGNKWPQDLGPHPVHSSPKAESISSQSGRHLYSLTIITLSSQGFQTLSGSPYWDSNILSRKKFFPMCDLKHCYNFSSSFSLPLLMDMENRLFSLFYSTFLHTTTKFSHQFFLPSH